MYVAQSYLPLVNNFVSIRGATTNSDSYTIHYWLMPLTYIGSPSDQYRFILPPFRWCYFVVGHMLRLCYVGGAAKGCHIAEKKSAILAECEVLQEWIKHWHSL